jgi:hypothetical protein
MPAPIRPTARIGTPPLAAIAGSGGARAAAGRLRERDRVLLVELAQTYAHSRSMKRAALAAAGPCTRIDRSLTGVVEQVVLRPQVMAADQRSRPSTAMILAWFQE